MFLANYKFSISMLQGVTILIPKVAFAMRVDGTLADFPRPSDFAG